MQTPYSGTKASSDHKTVKVTLISLFPFIQYYSVTNPSKTIAHHTSRHKFMLCCIIQIIASLYSIRLVICFIKVNFYFQGAGVSQ